MVGYPGETPSEFAKTAEFLKSDYSGHFMLSVFSLTDETMPVWSDAERLSIRSSDPSDPTAHWSHIGMDSTQATELQRSTLDAIRRDREDAVLLLWQAEFQHWLLPNADRRANLLAEKLVERLAFLPLDWPDPRRRAQEQKHLLDGLGSLGIAYRPGQHAVQSVDGPSLPMEAIAGG